MLPCLPLCIYLHSASSYAQESQPLLSTEMPFLTHAPVCVLIDGQLCAHDAAGLVFAARVPPGSGSVCPVTPAPIVTPAPTPKAATPAPTPAPSAPNAAVTVCRLEATRRPPRCYCVRLINTLGPLQWLVTTHVMALHWFSQIMHCCFQTAHICTAAAAAQAAAFGPPGGTSTSTAPGAAAAASGPPGTSRTATAPGAIASFEATTACNVCHGALA